MLCKRRNPEKCNPNVAAKFVLLANPRNEKYVCLGFFPQNLCFQSVAPTYFLSVIKMTRTNAYAFLEITFLVLNKTALALKSLAVKTKMKSLSLYSFPFLCL